MLLTTECVISDIPEETPHKFNARNDVMRIDDVIFYYNKFYIKPLSKNSHQA